jgi:hypothetical protein
MVGRPCSLREVKLPRTPMDRGRDDDWAPWTIAQVGPPGPSSRGINPGESATDLGMMAPGREGARTRRPSIVEGHGDAGFMVSGGPRSQGVVWTRLVIGPGGRSLIGAWMPKSPRSQESHGAIDHPDHDADGPWIGDVRVDADPLAPSDRWNLVRWITVSERSINYGWRIPMAIWSRW